MVYNLPIESISSPVKHTTGVIWSGVLVNVSGQMRVKYICIAKGVEVKEMSIQCFLNTNISLTS